MTSRYERLSGALAEYCRLVSRPGGLQSDRYIEAFVGQLVDSERRNLYVQRLLRTDLDDSCADPNATDSFDPLRAAILHKRQGSLDESFWMVFLYTHFGKNVRAGWRYARETYGRLGAANDWWTWSRVSQDVVGFRNWLDSNYTSITDRSRPIGFGNHRKYESLKGWSETGTGESVQTYVEWVGSPPSHAPLFDETLAACGGVPAAAFDRLYDDMATVKRFGRTARFDYLSMVGKLELARIAPGSAYLQDSTGPLAGARMFFGDPGASAADLETRLEPVVDFLGITFDVLEDSLCNWQKSPSRYRPFRG